MIFVNYLSKNTPKLAYKRYFQQHQLFTTTVLVTMPDSIIGMLYGNKGNDRFIEALTKLLETKKKADYRKESIFYLDNDCLLYRPIDDMLEIDFDVAVIYRYNWEEHGGHQDCLGGFLWFSGKRAKIENRFLEQVLEVTKKRYYEEVSCEIEPWFYDQLAINDVVGKPPIERTHEEYTMGKDYEPQMKNIDGANVLFLSANVFACPMTVVPRKDVRIFHYNHAYWPKEK